MKEKYKVTLTYAKEHTFVTTVTIDSDDPYTDVSDAAHDELSETVGECEVLHEEIDDVEKGDSKVNVAKQVYAEQYHSILSSFRDRGILVNRSKKLTKRYFLLFYGVEL